MSPVQSKAISISGIGPALREGAATVDSASIDLDYAFFYQGLAQGLLLIQKCGACQSLRNPPAPACPICHSLEWETQAATGNGHLYSYVVHYHPPLPNFTSPHAIALVTLEEGVRFMAALDIADLASIAIGMPVQARFSPNDDTPNVHFVPIDRL